MATRKVAVSVVAGEPDFETLVGELAVADLNAKAAGSDSKAASGERSRVAVSTIAAAIGEKILIEDVRRALLSRGVLKGTVSKITTVLAAIQNGDMALSDVKSLNGAYALSTKIKAAAAAARTGTPAFPVVSPEPTPVAGPALSTPEEALECIVNAVRDAKDVFKAAGEWITKITNEISAVLKESDEEEGE